MPRHYTEKLLVSKSGLPRMIGGSGVPAATGSVGTTENRGGDAAPTNLNPKTAKR